MSKILVILLGSLAISSCMMTGVSNLYRIFPVEERSMKVMSYYERKQQHYPKSLLVERDLYNVHIDIDDSMTHSQTIPITFSISNQAYCITKININIAPNIKPIQSDTLEKYQFLFKTKQRQNSQGNWAFKFYDSTNYHQLDGTYALTLYERQVNFDVIDCKTKQKIAYETFKYVPKKIGYYFVIDAL